MAAERFTRESQEEPTSYAGATRHRQLDILRVLSYEMAQEHDLLRLPDLVAQRATELLEADGGCVWLWEDDSGCMVPTGRHGDSADCRVSTHPGPLDLLAAGGGATVGLLDQLRKEYGAIEPLMLRGRILGAVGVRWAVRGERSATVQERDLLVLFASTAAVAVENARLHEAAMRREDKLMALMRAAQSVMMQDNLEHIVERIVAVASEVAGCEHTRVVLVDSAAGALRVVAQRGVSSHGVGDTIPLRGSLSGVVVETGEHVVSLDAQTDPRNAFRGSDQRLGIRSYLGVPIHGQQGVVGVLSLNSLVPRNFSRDLVGWLSSLADQVAFTVERARVHEDLQRAYEAQQRLQAEEVRSEKLRALGELAAGVAHDLNNILSTVLMRGETLRERVKDARLVDEADQLVRAVHDGRDVVQRVQAFARRDAAVARVPCRLEALVQDTLDLIRPRWQEETARRGVRIVAEMRLGVLPDVLGSPAEVREALTNLVLNAVDAMPSGGTVRFSGRVVRDDTADRREWVELLVEDTGVGMSEDVRRRIFDPFFTTKGLRGSGLGLSVVYGIMQRMAGSVSVESAPGRGSVFTLRFQPADGVMLPGTPRQETTGSCRVLLLDADSGRRRALASLLRACGHAVLETGSSAEARRCLSERGVDVLCVDPGSTEDPRADGYPELVEAAAHRPVFVLVRRDEMRRWESLGVVCMQKPVEVRDLAQRMGSAAPGCSELACNAAG